MAQPNKRKRSQTATGGANAKKQATTRTSAKNCNQDDNDTDCAADQTVRGNKGSKLNRKNILEAKQLVREKVDEALALLTEEKKCLTHREEHGKNLLCDRLSPSLRLHLTEGELDKPCEAFDDSLMALQRFKEIVIRYEVVNKASTGITAPTWMRWKQDAADLRALNERTMEVSCQVASELVSSGRWQGLSLLRSGEGDGEDVTKLAVELVEDALPERAEDTWGATAYRLAKAYGGMLKRIS